MAIKTIPLSRLETDLKKTLNECAESGETVIVEMPDQRLLAIQSLDPHEDDSLIDELLATTAEPALPSTPRRGSRPSASKLPPDYLRDAHYPGARKLGRGEGYVYPHDEPGGVAS